MQLYAAVPVAMGLMREVPQLAALGVTHKELYEELVQGIPVPRSMQAWLPGD
jgi:hypothetical protein